MENLIKIYCKNNNITRYFNAGVSLIDIGKNLGIQLSYPLICARVNNKTESLNYICYQSKTVEFIDISDPSGKRVYVRSLCFVFAKAVEDLFPGQNLYIKHSLSKGYYCEIDLKRKIEEEDVKAIFRRVQEIIEADYPFLTHEEKSEEVIALFRSKGLEDKARLLETIKEVYSQYNSLDGFVDSYYGALLPSTRWIRLFGLEKCNDGLLLRIPNPDNPGELQPYVKQEKMLSVFQELLQYQKTMQMTNAGDLNKAIARGEISMIVKVAEAKQERTIARIADEILAKYAGGVRIILISGPSSSGKTTLCKRLQVQLVANTLWPVGISLDDYYVNRVDTPLDETGEYDYESLYAIDLPKFNEDLKKILAGERVALPSYDFTQGKRVYRGNNVHMGKNAVIIMEGTHAMNPDLLPCIDPASIYKIYVSALTSISLDNHNWISTTDNRLLRRIVRDFQFRGYSAVETIARWPSVRRGEDKWIFPYQENADVMVNSAMLYEFAALRRMAEPILQEVPQTVPEYSEARRLLKFLRFFNHINLEELPNTSLLREFLGGSSFLY
ncbi:MAG: nucleoside kinase [Dysgonamonadaceae bacterium]|jgi:uridine kinase|nr:nucleoside kinase [Dysgonamonadaceae bacterium]